MNLLETSLIFQRLRDAQRHRGQQRCSSGDQQDYLPQPGPPVRRVMPNLIEEPAGQRTGCVDALLPGPHRLHRHAQEAGEDDLACRKEVAIRGQPLVPPRFCGAWILN